jgi:hypothetical protein
VGGKCLIAIYLPNTAFDTLDEPASFDCHLLRRQNSSAHTLLSTDFFSVRALCLQFFAQTVHFEGSTNPRQPPQFCHCGETHRASHTVTSSKGVRDAGSFEKAVLKQKEFPYVLVCPAILSFPLLHELTDEYLSIYTSPKYYSQIN